MTWDNTNALNANGRYRNTPSQRIDHIFLPRSLADAVVPLKATVEFVQPTVKSKAGCLVTLSDHYAVVAQVGIKSDRT